MPSREKSLEFRGISFGMARWSQRFDGLLFLKREPAENRAAMAGIARDAPGRRAIGESRDCFTLIYTA